MLPLKVGIKAATSSLTGVLLFRGGPWGGVVAFPYNSLCHLAFFQGSEGAFSSM